MNCPAFEHGVMRAGIQPGIATTHQLDIQLALLQIHAIDVGDFQLAARRRTESDLAMSTTCSSSEIQAGDGKARFWLGGFFLQAQRTASASNPPHHSVRGR